MNRESKNLDSKKCGSPPTEPSETSLTEPFLENPFYVKISPELSPTGNNQLLSEDTVLEISINAKILKSLDQEN